MVRKLVPEWKPSQIGRQFDHNYETPLSPNILAIKAWIRLIDFKRATLEIDNVSLTDSDSNHAYLDASIIILNSLLRDLRIPLFGPIEIVRTRRRVSRSNSGSVQFHALLDIPSVDESEIKECKLLLTVALRVVSWIQDHAAYSPEDPAMRDAFFRFIAAQMAEIATRLSARGKTTYHVLQACYEAGVPFCHVSGTVYQVGWGAKGQRIDRSLTDGDSFIGARLTHNKLLTAQLLHRAGLPAPNHTCVMEASDVRSAASAIGWPVVIKPADGERGEGVSVDVTHDRLETAFAVALQNSPSRRVLVERQVAGTCHRLFVAQGRLLYAVKRLPIGVYGDGERSITDLVQALADQSKSLPPWKREPIPEFDTLAAVELRRQGYTASYIPAAGTFVSFRRIETTAWGGVDEDVTEQIHPENVRIAEAAAKVAGLAVAGIDMISSDITRPWHENDAIINEINYAPLLGEGAISRRHVGTYLERLLGGDGRIPVSVYVGNEEAINAASAQTKVWRDQGLRTVITSHDWTEAQPQQKMPMPSDRLYDRVMALVLSRDTEALVILVQNDGLVDTGLPLEGVDTVAHHGTITNNSSGKPARIRRQQLLQMLDRWPWSRRDAFA